MKRRKMYLEVTCLRAKKKSTESLPRDRKRGRMEKWNRSSKPAALRTTTSCNVLMRLKREFPNQFTCAKTDITTAENSMNCFEELSRRREVVTEIRLIRR